MIHAYLVEENQQYRKDVIELGEVFGIDSETQTHEIYCTALKSYPLKDRSEETGIKRELLIKEGLVSLVESLQENARANSN